MSQSSLRASAIALSILPVLAACAEKEAAVITTMTIRHQETATTRAGADLAAVSAAYLRTFDSQLDLGLSSEDAWQVVSISDAGRTGLRYARLQQTHAGVPVFGSQILVRADDLTFLGFNGRHTANLDGFDVAPGLSDGEALVIAQQDFAAGAADSFEFADESAHLVILPRPDLAGADLAWQVEFANRRSGEVEPGRWTYFVGAGDGAVLRSFSSVYTLEQASGPGGNPKVSRTWTAALDVEPDGTGYRMDTDRMVTRDRNDGDQVVSGMDLGNMEDPVANDAHGFTEATLDMLSDWMGRASIDDAGLVIESFVHDDDFCPGAPLNACWSISMYYGDGGDAIPFVLGFHPFSGALDVVAHELHHGFTYYHSQLVYEGEPGGLNESFSDVAGTVAEFYHEGDAADFDVGEDISKQDAMRFMCDPRADRLPILGGSIDHMDDFDEGMDVHYSSGIGNRAFCLAVARYRATSWGSTTTDAVQQMGIVWFEANAGWWSAETKYVDACQGTIDAARAFGFDGEVAEAIASSWADVGVVCDAFDYACDDDGSCDVEDGETCASCAEDCGACSQDCSWFDRARCALGLGDCSRCDLPAACGDGACDGGETDETCGEDCGCAAPNASCDELSPAPFGCYCDAGCAESDDCCADVGEVCGD